jgi:predicted DNA-binding transcriptional regulator YafY
MYFDTVPGVRADRLVSLVLLLRQGGQMSASELARELEVSTRTVLRDIDALSVAGVPVYAERGRRGGFTLLPGFRTELTGLNHVETLALLAAGSGSGEKAFGLGSALASALRKVVDALPESHRATADDAVQRLLIDAESDLLERRSLTEEVAGPAMIEVRRAVLAGRKLRIHYAAAGQEPRWRTVDPIGLVTARGSAYLLATRAGADRTYRLSRVLAAEVMSGPAERSEHVDLPQIWRERSAQFRTGGEQYTVLVRVDPEQREELSNASLAVLTEGTDPDGWLRLTVTYQDARHAEWALWQLGPHVEALAPQPLRNTLHTRAVAIVQCYEPPS